MQALLLLTAMGSCTTTKYVTVPEVHEHWHHSTDTVTQTDSVIDRQTTTIREVDSATMAQYGIQMSALQTAWLIQTDRLQRELSALMATHKDTVRDSIPYPVEVVKEVSRERSTVEWVLLIVGIAAIAWIIIRITIKIKHV
jgi:hypothetical protein